MSCSTTYQHTVSPTLAFILFEWVWYTIKDMRSLILDDLSIEFPGNAQICLQIYFSHHKFYTFSVKRILDTY